MEWARTSNGSCPARDFFESIAFGDKAKVLKLLERFANHGISNQEKFKKLQEGLFEFKSFQVRLLGDFRPGKRFVVALGLQKKKDRHSPEDLDRARKILAENDQRPARSE